ncbi:MAG TPA: MoaD/ThiS family protein [Tahibacter sp.]|nr:MoaD/ThiS family protein [Tahibacter sp.]
MPKVVLASAVARHLRADAGEMALAATGATLADALADVCARHPTLRGYVVDEHGHVRHHVAIFIDGVALADKTRLDVPLRADAEIYVLQALSGG